MVARQDTPDPRPRTRDDELVALPRRLLRLRDYETLVASGAFDDERVELLFGEIVAMSPQNPPHRIVVQRLGKQLTVALGARANVQTHSAVLAADDSCPEPDVAVYDPDDDRAGRHPVHVHLVIEVSDTSRAKDLGPKRRLYGLSGFPEYWVVDVGRREVRVMRDPDGDDYRSVATFAAEPGVTLSPLRFPDVPLEPASWFDGL